MTLRPQGHGERMDDLAIGEMRAKGDGSNEFQLWLGSHTDDCLRITKFKRGIQATPVTTLRKDVAPADRITVREDCLNMDMGPRS